MSLFCRMAKAVTRSVVRGRRGAPRLRAHRRRRTRDRRGDSFDDAFEVPIDIGSGETQTIRTAAELIAEHYGAPAPHVTGQYRQGDVRHAWADVTEAERTLGWRPAWSLRDGITRLATWIDDQVDVPVA